MQASNPHVSSFIFIFIMIQFYFLFIYIIDVLFQEFVECPIEKRDSHLWKSVFYENLEAASAWLHDEPASDASTKKRKKKKKDHITI
jgi:hypothetical protein